MNQINFPFSDTIAGYVTTTDWEKNAFGLKTTDGREYVVKITDTTYGQIIRNPGEAFQSPGSSLQKTITADQYLFAYGIFYPENGGYTFEAKTITFVGRLGSEYRFETPDWWLRQIRSLAEFYLNAQFPDGNLDYRKYRTQLTLEGQKIESSRQETDTLSRMTYGFATAYMLTGEDRYLEAAERGTEYLRAHMRAVDEEKDVVYWYHAVEFHGTREHKIYASQFGDDYDAIPAYEQIYALAGPVQTYRVTGDPQILQDTEKTVNLFEKYFLDRDKGGYFSHIDPITFDPHSATLNIDKNGIHTENQTRKNWNSNGDHTPAYLINLWLATGDERYAKFLISTADIIEQHFQDFQQSPFVYERFHEDWTPDLTWGWQQNRAVVGHNFKIAWNMMRVHHLCPKEEKQYVTLAKRIVEAVSQIGLDRQRGGLYDTMERHRNPGEEWHRCVWHDRKAWWQQEQAILAFLILYGSLHDPQYLKLAREIQSFYNAFFPDTDNGGVYFNVLGTGTPYLVGMERLKASHSMSGYHSFELCYLAAVYTNLLITKKPMDLYFKPKPGAFKDNILRVQPDLLPPGSIRLTGVWINGDPYNDFDAEAMTIRLPEEQLQIQPQLAMRPALAGNPYLAPAGRRELKVRVRLAPTGLLFDSTLDITDKIAQFTLLGNLNDSAIPAFRVQFEKIAALQPPPPQVVLRMEGLHSISPQAARVLSFYDGTINPTQDFYAIGANDEVKKVLNDAGTLGALIVMDHYDIGKIGMVTSPT